MVRPTFTLTAKVMGEIIQSEMEISSLDSSLGTFVSQFFKAHGICINSIDEKQSRCINCESPYDSLSTSFSTSHNTSHCTSHSSPFSSLYTKSNILLPNSSLADYAEILNHFTITLNSPNAIHKRIFNLEVEWSNFISRSCGTSNDVWDNQYHLRVEEKCILRGGKGGFGAQMKGKEARRQFKKVTYNGASRNLQGQRIRSLNQDADIEQWRRQTEEQRRQQEDEQRRQRIEKTNAIKKNIIDDVLQENQKESKIVASAVQEIMREKKNSQSGSILQSTPKSQIKIEVDTDKVSDQLNSATNEAPNSGGPCNLPIELNHSRVVAFTPLDPPATMHAITKKKKRSLFDEEEIYNAPRKRVC